MKEVTYKIYTSLPQESVFIRTTVFVKEQGFFDEFDSTDKTAYHLIAYLDNIAIGTARFFLDKKEDNTYVIGRLAVLKEYRDRHLGSEIVKEAEKIIKKYGAKKIVLSAQCKARKFYKNLGYFASGEIYLDEQCPHIHMEKYIN